MFKPTPLFHFSHAGPDVRLLDPPEHVPDSEVPGDYRWYNLPRRESHAGPKSSEEVRLLMAEMVPREALFPERSLAPPLPNEEDSGGLRPLGSSCP